ncbi:MAG: class I SAM-dependent methyltransferase [Candidatus Omnitrophota bacterium]
MGCITKVLSDIAKFLFRNNNATALAYWQKRAKHGGFWAALNSGYSLQDFAVITQTQKDILFPFLKQHLRGSEKLVLDFGCGPGRFSADLARLTMAKVVAVDPVKHFLRIAPKDKHVVYKCMQAGHIPLSGACVDIVWVCLVLGGIMDEIVLHNTISEMHRALKGGGLIFLVENTTEKQECDHWKYRPVRVYQELFSFAQLRSVGEYNELGERISIMVGRKTEDMRSENFKK